MRLTTTCSELDSSFGSVDTLIEPSGVFPMPRPGPRTTPRYSEAFKATAVRLSQLPDVSLQDVAASLYIHPFMLSRWRKQAREGLIMAKGVQVDKDVAAELKELRKLKKAHERLKLEHEILKKAIEFTSARKARSLPSSSIAKPRTR
jgi:transposase